jgi:hypothetical protein
MTGSVHASGRARTGTDQDHGNGVFVAPGGVLDRVLSAVSRPGSHRSPLSARPDPTTDLRGERR